MHRWLRILLLSCPCLIASLPARAGNDDEIPVGNQAAMTGGAVGATVADSSATWYNPAGLGAATRQQIDVSGTAYTLRSYAAPRFLSSAGGQSDSASVVEFVSAPAQVAYVRQLRPGLSVGLGYFVPQASNLVLRESLRLEQDGQRSAWQVALHTVRVQHTAALGLGLALARRVRLGFSLVGTYQDQTQSLSVVAVQGASDAAVAEQQRFLSSQVLGTGSWLGVEAGVGFQLELTPAWRLGLSARSARALVYQQLHVTGASGISVAGGAEEPASILADIADPTIRGARFDIIRAGRLGLALAWLSARGDWIALEADVQPAIDAPEANIRRRSVVNARLGAYYRYSDALALGAGLFTDRSPDRRTTDPISGYGHFYGASLGLEQTHWHRLAQGEAAEAMSFSTTLALRYAFSRGSLNDLSVDPAALDQLGSRRGPLLVHELGLYVGGGLSF